MARPLKEIEQELLMLARKERADIALRLIRSLDEGIEEDVDAYWRKELVRRSQKNEGMNRRGASELSPCEKALFARRLRSIRTDKA